MAKLRITALEGEHQGEALEAQFNPKEIEVDRARPQGPAKPDTPVWKIAVYIAVPLIVIGAAAYYITGAGKIGGDERRSIQITVPK